MSLGLELRKALLVFGQQSRYISGAENVLILASRALYFAAAPHARSREVHRGFASRALKSDGVSITDSGAIARVNLWVRIHS